MHKTKAHIIYNNEQHQNVINELEDGADLIAENYTLYKSLAGENIKYLFKNVRYNGASEPFRAMHHLALNWYRDDYGEDLLYSNGISIGPMMTRRIIFAFCNDFRNYNALSYWLKKYEKIAIPEIHSESIQRVSKVLGERLDVYKTSNNENLNISSYSYKTSSPEITNLINPRIHPLSRFARLVQLPFLRFVKKKKKILYLYEWSSIGVASKRTDILLGNSKYPWRGHYKFLHSDTIKSAEFCFPAVVNKKVASVDNIGAVMERIGVKWDHAVLQLFVNVINYEYNSNRNVFIQNYAMYRELLEYYEPEILILPGGTDYGNIIIAQVALELGIKTMLLIDGYFSVYQSFDFFKDRTGKGFLFDTYFALGGASKDFLLDLDMPAKQIQLIAPPIIDIHKTLNKKTNIKEKRYDVMILTYGTHFRNIYSPWDQLIKIEVDILSLLQKFNFTDIAIKIKPPYEKQDRTEKIYRMLLKKNYGFDFKGKLHFVDDQLYKVCDQARLIIGQVSTAVLESYHLDVPFYIYEPYETGISDEMIASAKIFSPDSVARTLGQLKKVIESGRASVTESKDYLLDGPSLSSVKIY